MNDDSIEENINIDKVQNNSNININNEIEKKSKNENINIFNENNDKQQIESKSEKEIKENKDKDIKKEEKKNYIHLAKDYINKSSNDPEYSELIKTNPLSLFDSMDEKKLERWETLLTNICPLTFQMTKDKDQEILSFPFPKCSQSTVIQNDSKRTRVRESKIYEENYADTLSKVLNYYCQKYKLVYKQGLNEIFGPLVLLKYKIKKLSLTSVINLGAMIIDTFLPNYFYEKEIYSLKSALGLFLILLKYHEPNVYNKLDLLEVGPEIYATNWFVTYISGKLNLNDFFSLWDMMITIVDPLFIQFVLVGIIKEKRELILNCDSNLLATLMTSLTIKTKDELKKAFKIANEIRIQTPYSFRLLADRIGFLKKKYKDIKTNYEKYQPELLPAMPIFPSEVLYITYKSQIYCIDPNCKNYATDFKLKQKKGMRSASRTLVQKNVDFNPNQKAISNVEKNYLCEKCDIGIEKNMQYILLDLRILEYGENDDDTDKTGFLPSMISVPQDELKSEDFSNIMRNRFISERGNYHFIFLTTNTDTFNDFESNYYMDNISEEDRRKMMFGVIEQKKIDKELNFDDAKKNLSRKQIYKLKEYDNMRNTLKTMIKHNFPFVGYVYGGFNAVHKETHKFKVELLGHNEDICLLCKEEKNGNEIEQENEEDNEEKNELYNSLWEHKEKIKYKNLDIFFKNPNNKMHLCILKEYKKKDIEEGQVQILINELYDKFVIEIYKFDKRKQYNDFETTIMIKNKKEKKEYYDYGIEDDEEDNNKDLELTLLEKVPVFDMLKITQNQKAKNIVTCEIRGESKKEKILGLFKKKDNNYEIITIVFDFSSSKDAKSFILSFKEMIEKYKQEIKK